MIDAMIKILKDKNIIETSDPTHYYYYFNNRDNINLFLYSKREKKLILSIKVSDLRDFEKTFNHMKMVHGKIPQIIPEPVCFFMIKKYQFLVTKAYEIELLVTKPHFDIKKRKLLFQSVANRIEELQLKTVDGYLKFDKEFSQEIILPEVNKFIEKWRDQNLQQAFKLHMEKLSKHFGVTIPRIPQHGDLVMLNTGLIDAEINKIMFINWDSYSDIQLPVYDLLIFTLTFINFYGENMYFKSELTNCIKEIFYNYCKTLGLDINLVIDLYPICLILFSNLKADIGICADHEFALREIKHFFSENKQFILHHP